MNIHETLVYGKRGGFVYLRYVSIVFFFISQIANYYVVLHVMEQAANALEALETADVAGVLQAFMSFKLGGAFGTLIEILRSLSCLVIPLYFIATISFVLNLNRREIGKITRRTVLVALLLFFAEFFVYLMIVGMAILLIEQLFAVITEQYADLIDIATQIIQTFNAHAELIPFKDATEALAYAKDFAGDRLTLLLLNNVPSFNIFLDQLLCLLMCIFFSLRPKWANTEGKLALFRAFGLIPILYIAATFLLNGLMHSGVIEPTLTLLCIFPAKRLPHFLFIGCILLCNRAFAVRGPWSERGYMQLAPSSKKVYRTDPLALETAGEAKKRALTVAAFLSVCLLLLSAVDFCLGFLPFAADWGLGKSYYAVFCIPFLFFFDDRKPTTKRAYSVFSGVYFAVILTVVLIYLFF